jgi:hypothetical protein
MFTDDINNLSKTRYGLGELESLILRLPEAGRGL